MRYEQERIDEDDRGPGSVSAGRCRCGASREQQQRLDVLLQSATVVLRAARRAGCGAESAERRVRAEHVGDGGEPRWRGLCRRVYGHAARRSVAGESRDFGAEGKYGECIQSFRTGAFDGEHLSATQPGGSLYGLQASNPVNTEVAYRGDSKDYGQSDDPMVGGKIGGVNVFGGGLALYNSQKQLIGAVGVSGDSSCADHNIAWRTRHNLKLDYVPAGVSGDTSRPDNIVYDITTPPGFAIGVSAGGWGHPVCSAAAKTIAASLPVIP